MSTFLTLNTEHGWSRCDSRCHNATGPRSRCICKGRYHGLGDAAAAELFYLDIQTDPHRYDPALLHYVDPTPPTLLEEATHA
jgi:hypothetical protein